MCENTSKSNLELTALLRNLSQAFIRFTKSSKLVFVNNVKTSVLKRENFCSTLLLTHVSLELYFIV